MGDPLTLLLVALSCIFLIILVGMNSINCLQVSEGFEAPKAQAPSNIEVQIRAVLDEMDSKEICPLYTVIRSNMLKNEKAGQDISDQEAKNRVEAALAIKIPGGALPCPLFTYPKAASDLEWLDFLQKIPVDFGARVVLMAIYAQGFLADKENILKDALSGNGTPPVSDGFAVCTPDLADSRRAEKQKVKGESCTLPEDLSPAQIQEAITKLLKDLVANKNTVLKTKKIDPTIDIKPLLTQAKASAAYITKKSEQAQSGTLQMDGPIKMQPKNAE